VNARQVKEMIELAKSENVFFMEAIWSRCTPAYANVRQLVQEGQLGDVKRIAVQMGINWPKEWTRLLRANEGGGTVLDFGVYCIQLALMVFGEKKPTKIQSIVTEVNDHGVDMGIAANIAFPKGILSINTELNADLGNAAEIFGSKGKIKVSPTERSVNDIRFQIEPVFWAPSEITVHLKPDEPFKKTFPFPTGPFVTTFNKPEGAVKSKQERLQCTLFQMLIHEAEEVRRCLQAGLMESPLVTHGESIIIAGIQDEIHRQIGVTAFEKM